MTNDELLENRYLHIYALIAYILIDLNLYYSIYIDRHDAIKMIRKRLGLE